MRIIRSGKMTQNSTAAALILIIAGGGAKADPDTLGLTDGIAAARE